MPEHAHLLVEGLHGDSDLRLFMKNFKQCSSYAYKRETGHLLWQDGYHDHVLRDEEQTEAVARYILENPVRAGLVRHPLEWPYLASERYDLRQLLESVSYSRA